MSQDGVLFPQDVDVISINPGNDFGHCQVLFPQDVDVIVKWFEKGGKATD